MNFEKPQKSLINNNATSVSNIAEDAKKAESVEDFINCTYEFFSLLNKLNDSYINDFFYKTNPYVLLLNAVFENKKFRTLLKEITQKEADIFNEDSYNLNVEDKKFINSGILLAFSSVASSLFYINDNSIVFLRKHVTHLIREIYKESSGDFSFTNLCFKLNEISWNFEYSSVDKIFSKFVLKNTSETLKSGRSLAGVSFLSLTINPALSEQFRKVRKNMENEENFSISKELSNIYSVIHKIEKYKEHYYKTTPKNYLPKVRNFFERFTWENDRNLVFFIKIICSDFHYQEGKKFYEVVLEKIKRSSVLEKAIIQYGKENLKAFRGDLEEEEHGWANKVFIVSLKALSLLSRIEKAKDSRWKVSVAVYELRQWINGVYKILNKYYFDDDWDYISEYLIEENVLIEWKSSFFTATERESFDSHREEKDYKKRIFKSLVNAVLGMLNTSGGIIIVGLIENPERIYRKELHDCIIIKNGKTFLDIRYELEKYDKTIDSLRLQLFDYLVRRTGLSHEKFNHLISFEPIFLRDEKSGDNALVIKINVKKSNTHFFNIKEEKGATWISLTKRAEGRTVSVDIRDYIEYGREEDSTEFV